MSNAARFVANPPRILLLQTGAGLSKNSLAAETLSLATGRDINAPPNRLVKRTVDLAISVPAMLVALPLIGVLALLIKAFSPGPAFYQQTRVGFGNRAFRVFKLRTMHPTPRGFSRLISKATRLRVSNGSASASCRAIRASCPISAMSFAA
jgi:lipopolysaccharide/colanic/teichoic acid biosynthesis glycosyltransferase